MRTCSASLKQVAALQPHRTLFSEQCCCTVLCYLCMMRRHHAVLHVLSCRRTQSMHLSRTGHRQRHSSLLCQCTAVTSCTNAEPVRTTRLASVAPPPRSHRQSTKVTAHQSACHLVKGPSHDHAELCKQPPTKLCRPQTSSILFYGEHVAGTMRSNTSRPTVITSAPCITQAAYRKRHSTRQTGQLIVMRDARGGNRTQ
jgi:hypothetical protein